MKKIFAFVLSLFVLALLISTPYFASAATIELTPSQSGNLIQTVKVNYTPCISAASCTTLSVNSAHISKGNATFAITLTTGDYAIAFPKIPSTFSANLINAGGTKVLAASSITWSIPKAYTVRSSTIIPAHTALVGTVVATFPINATLTNGIYTAAIDGITLADGTKLLAQTNASNSLIVFNGNSYPLPSVQALSSRIVKNSQNNGYLATFVFTITPHDTMPAPTIQDFSLAFSTSSLTSLGSNLTISPRSGGMLVAETPYTMTFTVPAQATISGITWKIDNLSIQDTSVGHVLTTNTANLSKSLTIF